MGYYIEQHDTCFIIKKKNFTAVRKALIKAINSSKISDWVNISQINKKGLKRLLEECRWEPAFSKAGDIDYIRFTGQKIGNEEELFKTLAPFVEPGCYIEIFGEEDAHWQYQFDGKKMKEVGGVLDYEENIEIVNALLETKEVLPTLIGIHPKLDAKIAKVLNED
jgi:hypothetical protein